MRVSFERCKDANRDCLFRLLRCEETLVSGEESVQFSFSSFGSCFSSEQNIHPAKLSCFVHRQED